MEAEVLLCREVTVQGRVLEHQADHAPDLVLLGARVVTGDHGPAGGRFGQGAEDLDGRRLAGPVRPEEAERLSPGHLEVDPAHRLQFPVLFRQAGNAYNRFAAVPIATEVSFAKVRTYRSHLDRLPPPLRLPDLGRFAGLKCSPGLFARAV